MHCKKLKTWEFVFNVSGFNELFVFYIRITVLWAINFVIC